MSAGLPRRMRLCRSCPTWVQQQCIRRVLGEKRWWLTAEEFLAQVEAHKLAHDKERLNPKAVNQTPSEVKVYWLDLGRIYTPK